MKTLKILTMLMVLTCGAQVVLAQGPTRMEDRKRQMDSIRYEQQFHKDLLENPVKYPCYVKDDDEWFAASNNMEGELGDPKLANALLQSCQEQLYMKLSGRVKQLGSYYFDYVNANKERKAANHIESLCQKEVNQLVMETREACREHIVHPSPYKQDKIILFMAIQVRKIDLLKVMEEAIKNDEEAKVRFNEQKFRDAYSKAFEDNKQQE